MPSMANITVKANNGTTDVVYTAMSPSSGDGVPAVWRNEAGGTATAFKTSLQLVSKYNGNKTARRLNATYYMPQTATDSTTSLTRVVNTVPINFSIALPVETPQTIIDEAVSQFANLLVSTLIKDSLKSGYAPT